MYNGTRALFSSAPLAEVASVEIFYQKEKPENKNCLGILFVYHNGSQRALGQCRIGVDSSTIHKDPMGICIANPLMGSETPTPSMGTSFRGVRVEVVHGQHQDHVSDLNVDWVPDPDADWKWAPDPSVVCRGWECLPMKGVLEFWYTNFQSKVQYVRDE